MDEHNKSPRSELAMPLNGLFALVLVLLVLAAMAGCGGRLVF